MSTLRPIQALTFPDVTPAPDVGPLPRLAIISPTVLMVDAAYQRALSRRSIELIRRIVAEWRWRAFKPPIVVSTTEGLHVIDGQHTAIAAATHPGVTEIPVLIVEAEDMHGRAEAFVRHNRDRLQITGTQLHFALAAAGDDVALTIERVCQRAGARVLRTSPGDGRFIVGDTMAIEVLRALVNRRHAKGAREVLQVCVEGRMAPVTAAALKAVERLLFAPDCAGQIDPRDLATLLRAMDTTVEREVALFAAEHKVPQWRGLAAVLLRNAKKGRGHGRRNAA